MELAQAWTDFDLLRNSSSTLAEFKIDEEGEYHCEFCGGRKQFDAFDDLPVCIDCGRVDPEYVSNEPEWRSGVGEDGGQSADPCRVGAPVNTDHFSAAWGASTFMTVQRGATWAQKRLSRINMHASMNHRDRALFHAYAQLDRVGKTVLNLPDNVMYQAKIKYKAFNEAVLTRGAVRNGIKANCIFQACREFGVARTTQEIAQAFGIPARDLSRTFEIYQEQVPETEVHVTTSGDLIARMFNSVTCVPDADRGRVRMRMIKMCDSLADCVELMGRTPKAVACAVMHIVLVTGGYNPVKADLCKICDVSVPTLSKIETIIKNELKDTK
jgi:transcription initiation factor TFIIIB Brf1 subunit/transcription initiation factor TFIIB